LVRRSKKNKIAGMSGMLKWLGKVVRELVEKSESFFENMKNGSFK